MTREEAKAVITGHLDHWNRLLKEKICDPTEGVDTTEAFKVAIETLWQEPCEDVISRKEVKDLYYKNGYIDFRKVCELPPVNTQTKTGYWKKIATYPLYECSKCKLESMLNTWDYYPNCGCRMFEPQESEDKE